MHSHDHSSRRRRSRATQIAAATTTIAGIVTLTSCTGLGDKKFAVGDCVTIRQRTLDHDLRSADCASAVGTMNFAERVYKVDEVLGRTDATCGTPQGFFGVAFSHEPHGVTYCLTMAT